MNIVTRPSPSGHGGAIDSLRTFIESGRYGPGDRLPPERDLIKSLGISRTTLRKALDALEREGAIWRHVGKGTFISHEPTLPGDLAGLSRQITPVKMMRARLSIEPAIAREAAINASAEAVARLRLCEQQATQAETWAEYEAQDDFFHRAVAEASDNIVLVALFDRLNDTRRAVAGVSVVRRTPKPATDHPSYAEHREIVAAIEARDAHRSFDAMRRHIGSVSARLFGEV